MIDIALNWFYWQSEAKTRKWLETQVDRLPPPPYTRMCGNIVIESVNSGYQKKCNFEVFPLDTADFNGILTLFLE